MTDRIYGDLSDWRAQLIGNKWEIFTDDCESVWVIPWRPTPEQLDSMNRIYNFAYDEGRLYGERATRREIRQALGLEKD